MVCKASALSAQIPSATRPPIILAADASQLPSIDVSANEKSHYGKEQVDCYRNAALQNDAKAAYNLGVCYRKGEGVNIDDKFAFQWFKRAADLGLLEAQLAAGICYYMGSGTPQNYPEALKLLQPLAEQGNKHAQYFLGDYHYYERENYPQAAKWYAAAAEQKHVAALNNLGLCYENGHGVQQSDLKALQCFQQASAQFLPIALINQGRCYLEGRGTDANPDLASSLLQQAEMFGGEEAKYTILVSASAAGSHSASPAS